MERTISPKTYAIVWACLILFTVLTMSVSFLPITGIWHLVIGLVIGLVKGSLVVMFFMHLGLSDRVTWAVVAVAAFWLGILIVLTLTDYFSRGMVPFAPGH